MSAIVPFSGTPRSLDGRREPDEQITEEQATDPPRVARLLMSLLKSVADIKRRFAANHTDFMDWPVDSTATTKYRFPHNYNRRVVWWPIDWKPTGAGSGGANLERHDDTDANTLVLVSDVEGIVSIRVEEAG